LIAEPLNPYNYEEGIPNDIVFNMDYAGKQVCPMIANGVANGDLHPVTHEKYTLDYFKNLLSMNINDANTAVSTTSIETINGKESPLTVTTSSTYTTDITKRKKRRRTENSCNEILTSME